MTQIKTLFDSNKDIYRAIEKVISYQANAEGRLKSEISEYVVTDAIENSLESLLDKMQLAMDHGGENEIGVWVSGFYGSGKSSLTKYLGLALDDSIKIDGVPFIQHLQDRLKGSRTKALLNTLAKRFPAAVVMLDLASEQLAGATMEDVATVLYYKVLQWAGYSRNLKVAAFERRLKKDGRFDDFQAKFSEMLDGEKWADYQDDPAVVDGIVPMLAHEMYPQLWPTEESFNTATDDTVVFENQRVSEMINIAREASGKEHIIFVIDEVGQYVGSRENLILNLDGLAKNLKAIGDGKVWIIGTAQQTLAEDDANIALNSPQLYKLKDRFPIQLELESSDIKEICYRRLLGKSPTGDQVVGELFDMHGQSLRHATKLEGNKYYEADFDRTSFINLYPFLPAHFEILLNLLGALAKSTGGIGLRSAIKVIQDVLVEGIEDDKPIAERDVGWLASSVTLYDALEKDIRRAFRNKHDAVGKVLISNFYDSPVHVGVAKTVAILEILNNLPVTRQNIAGLMHDGVSSSTQQEAINQAVEELISDPQVPFGEKEGQLCFFSERLNDIERERAQLRLPSVDVRRIFSSALKDVMSPLPSTRLGDSFSVSTGIKHLSEAGLATSLNGERNPIQTVLEFVSPQDFENARDRLIDQSRHNPAEIYLLARTSPEVEGLKGDIYRCQEIANRYRNDADKEIKDYCNGQLDRANSLIDDLHRLTRRSLINGEFIFRGHNSAVEGFDQELLEANKKHLASVAGQVFDRYQEAPVRIQTNVAERFLKADNLSAINSEFDPLQLVVKNGGSYSINESHQALSSIRSYIDTRGGVDGKVLSDHFGRPPFGWSPDTLRYLLAAMLVDGQIKLKVSGIELTNAGQKAIEALKSNNSFKTVGVNLRDDRPSPDMCLRAAERLTELTGDQVFPLEDDISKAAVKYFGKAQHEFGSLGEKLRSLSIPGDDRLDGLSSDLADLLYSDASEAPQRLGAEESQLYNQLVWASALKRALLQGLEKTLSDLSQLMRGIIELPDGGIPGKLKLDLADELTAVRDRLQQSEFYNYAADFSTQVTTIKTAIAEASTNMGADQSARIKQAEVDITRVPGWNELTQPEKEDQLAKLDGLALEARADLTGLRDLLNQDFQINVRLEEIKRAIAQTAQERVAQQVAEEKAKYQKEGKTKIERKVSVPRVVTDRAALEELIMELSALKSQLELDADIEIHLEMKG